MRRLEKEIKDPAILETIFHSADICRIALIDNGKPYIVPLNFGYKNNTLYFHSAKEGKKIEVLQNNRYVCFEVETGVKILKEDNKCNWGTKYRSVIGYGNIEFVDDIKGKIAGLNTLMEKYGSYENEYDTKYLENLVVLKLSVDLISGKQSGSWE